MSTKAAVPPVETDADRFAAELLRQRQEFEQRIARLEERATVLADELAVIRSGLVATAVTFERRVGPDLRRAAGLR